jgi:energy-coupling factor transporter ATP-binding protein EcfA2
MKRSNSDLDPPAASGVHSAALHTPQPSPKRTRREGFAYIFGPPGAGKSSLINSLTGVHILPVDVTSGTVVEMAYSNRDGFVVTLSGDYTSDVENSRGTFIFSTLVDVKTFISSSTHSDARVHRVTIFCRFTRIPDCNFALKIIDVPNSWMNPFSFENIRRDGILVWVDPFSTVEPDLTGSRCYEFTKDRSGANRRTRR